MERTVVRTSAYTRPDGRVVAAHLQRAKPRGGETRRCVVCRSSFYVYPSQVGDPSRKAEFCSRKCYSGRARSERMLGIRRTPEQRLRLSASKTGVPQPWHAKPVIERQCVACGDTFAIPRKRPMSERVARRFCGSACWYDYIRLHPEENGAFRGGVEPYYGPDWPEQARRARERDGFRCRDCGLAQSGPDLDVHHLVPRRTFLGDYRRANALANLITLCKACHARRERNLTKRSREVA